RLRDRLRHRAGVGGVETVRGVAEPMDVHAAVAPDARRLRLEHVDSPGQVEITRTAGSESRIVHDGANAREPRLVVETDAYQQARRPEPAELAWGDLDRVRIVKGWGQALDRDALAAHRGDQRLEIRRGCHHGDHVRRRGGPRGRGG